MSLQEIHELFLAMQAARDAIASTHRAADAAAIRYGDACRGANLAPGAYLAGPGTVLVVGASGCAPASFSWHKLEDVQVKEGD